MGELRGHVACREAVDPDDRHRHDSLYAGARPGLLQVAGRGGEERRAAACASDGLLAASTMDSTPASASSRPAPVTTSTPLERDIATTSCPASSSRSTTCRPTRPVAPATAIFMLPPPDLRMRALAPFPDPPPSSCGRRDAGQALSSGRGGGRGGSAGSSARRELEVRRRSRARSRPLR
jgi:hypothetical protein